MEKDSADGFIGLLIFLLLVGFIFIDGMLWQEYLSPKEGDFCGNSDIMLIKITP